MKKELKLSTILMITLCLVLCFMVKVPCKAAGSPVNITKKTATIKAGTTFKFKASITGQKGKTVRWSVSDKSMASISKSGKFTAKKAGKVTVTATYQNSKANISITITPKKIIGIDPGHQVRGNYGLEPNGPGSNTKKPKVSSGTQGIVTRVNEYELNLAIAKKLKNELENRGYAVVMTRTSHKVNIPNSKRAKLLNASGADIAIRIHADGSDNHKRTGASALYTSTSNRFVKKSVSKKSKRLASCILNSYCKKSKIKNNGMVVRNDLTGNNNSKIPVMLLEMGYMSNPKEDRAMETKKTQNKMAVGIADGIDAYFS